jgi:hypothetical protein
VTMLLERKSPDYGERTNCAHRRPEPTIDRQELLRRIRSGTTCTPEVINDGARVRRMEERRESALVQLARMKADRERISVPSVLDQAAGREARR